MRTEAFVKISQAEFKERLGLPADTEIRYVRANVLGNDVDVQIRHPMLPNVDGIPIVTPEFENKEFKGWKLKTP